MSPLDRVLNYKRVGEERDEFIPRIKVNLLKEARHNFFMLCTCRTVYTMYIYTDFLNLRATCGSADQPIPSPIFKALSQPKPHPSDRTVKADKT